MTGAADIAFRRRVLAQRTEALDRRGQEQVAGLLPERLVCATGDRLYGIAPSLVLAVRPHGCHPLPLISARAAQAMLGVFAHGGQLYSVLDLARLQGEPGDAAAAGGAGGTMLLLRGGDRRIALRVDRVLGLLALREADTDARFGLLVSGSDTDATDRAAPDRDDRLVTLIDPAALREAVASLDRPGNPETDPALTGA